MNKKFESSTHIEAHFYETYEICRIVDDILLNRFDYLRDLEGFYCDGRWAEWIYPYKKYSVFHSFIEFVARNVHSEQAGAVDLEGRKNIIKNSSSILEELGDFGAKKLPVEIAFERYKIDHDTFVDYIEGMGTDFSDANDDDVYDFMNEIFMSDAYDKLITRIVKEVFHILFQNRILLMNFNIYVSQIIANRRFEVVEDLDLSLLTKDRKLKRVNPPTWAKRAVFFRDRGHCVLCDKDLSGLLNLDNLSNYDHVVPLHKFGINDVTNLQLLCEPCNNGIKGAHSTKTSNVYQSWYSYD